MLQMINPRPHLLFRHPRPQGGGVPPPLRVLCPLIAIEVRNKDEQKVRDVLDQTIPDFTTLVAF